MKLSRQAVQNLAAPAPDWRWRVWMPAAPMTVPSAGGLLARTLGTVLDGSYFSRQASQFGQALAGSVGAGVAGTLGQFVDQTLGGLGGALGGIGGQQIMAEQITFNHVQTSAHKRFTGGGYDYFPESSDVTAASITFYEDVNYTVSRYLAQWRRSIHGPDGSYGLPGEYKRTIVLECFNYTNDSSPVLTGTLSGCWPTEQGALELAYNSEGRVTVQCSFSVDDSKIQ